VIVKQLKDWATRERRSVHVAGPRQLVWADHASTMYLYEEGSLDAKTTGRARPPELEGEVLCRALSASSGVLSHGIL
jgi:hypothetical protein